MINTLQLFGKIDLLPFCKWWHLHAIVWAYLEILMTSHENADTLIRMRHGATRTHWVHEVKARRCGQEAGRDTSGWSGPWIIEARRRAFLLHLPQTKQIKNDYKLNQTWPAIGTDWPKLLRIYAPSDGHLSINPRTPTSDGFPPKKPCGVLLGSLIRLGSWSNSPLSLIKPTAGSGVSPSGHQERE